MPLRLLDAAAVAELTDFAKAPHYSSHTRLPSPSNNDNCRLMVGGSCGCVACLGRLRSTLSPNFSAERGCDAWAVAGAAARRKPQSVLLRSGVRQRSCRCWA